jgi:uncharacterized protein YggT (Ycf19 family)
MYVRYIFDVLIYLVVICSGTTCVMVEYLIMLFGSMCMVQFPSWLHNIVVPCSPLVRNILIHWGHIEGSGFIAYFSLNELCCKCNVKLKLYSSGPLVQLIM